MGRFPSAAILVIHTLAHQLAIHGASGPDFQSHQSSLQFVSISTGCTPVRQTVSSTSEMTSKYPVRDLMSCNRVCNCVQFAETIPPHLLKTHNGKATDLTPLESNTMYSIKRNEVMTSSQITLIKEILSPKDGRTEGRKVGRCGLELPMHLCMACSFEHSNEGVGACLLRGCQVLCSRAPFYGEAARRGIVGQHPPSVGHGGDRHPVPG